MSTPASYKVFVSAVSNELESYREEVARVLRRRHIEVRDQKHFRQGGGTLLEQLRDYIDECDATICLIGEQPGSVPGSEHVSDAGVQSEWADRLRDATGNSDISYTQWEYLLAKTLGKETYVFLTDDGFVPDKPPRGADSDTQACYREWIRSTGENWSPLTTVSQLIEDVLVLPFPDLSQGQPNNLPHGSLGSLFKGREQFLNDLRQQLGSGTSGATTAIISSADPTRPAAVHGAGGIGKTRCAIEYAWRHSGDYTALLFLSADSPQALDSSLASLSGVLAIEGLDAAKPEQRIQAALDWLQAHPGWLAILDNVDTDEAAVAVKSRLAALTQGHVLITSRLSKWSAGVQTLDLGVLTLEDATSYLLEATDANRVHTEQDHE